MSKQSDDVSITLTAAQLAQVARATSRGDLGVASLHGPFESLSIASRVLDATDTASVSRSVLRALLVLSAFPLNGDHRALAEVSKEVGYNPSTTHRYVNTWLAIGLLEQDPKSRKYRRPVSPAVKTLAIPQSTKKASSAKKRTGSVK
jgi:hypothetical protein